MNEGAGFGCGEVIRVPTPAAPLRFLPAGSDVIEHSITCVCRAPPG